MPRLALSVAVSPPSSLNSCIMIPDIIPSSGFSSSIYRTRFNLPCSSSRKKTFSCTAEAWFLSISNFINLSAAIDANGTNVSLKPSAIIDIKIDANKIGRKILLNDIPRDFNAINSLLPLRVDIPKRVANNDDIGIVITTTSGIR